ncbi:hypothetical protein MN0502_06630 [Arthrobacter sp. MN05-02]|nr:hypothetical protein MN0502_06630 [Arthrobacter sp. MN05-02]
MTTGNADEPQGRIPSGAAKGERHTRAGAIWTAVIAAIVLLVLLIVFFLQNDTPVLVTFFGLEGSIALGLALLIAAVGGGAVVALVGAIRIIQLRAVARRNRR